MVPRGTIAGPQPHQPRSRPLAPSHTITGLQDCEYSVVDARHIQWGNDGPPGLFDNPGVSGVQVNFYPYVGAPDPPAPITALPTPVFQTTQCPRYVFIGMRGSGEGGKDYLGNQLPAIKNGFVAQLEKDGRITNDSDVEVIGIPYAATAVPFGNGWDSVNSVQAGIQTLNKISNYIDGAWYGTTMLISQLKEQRDKCGSSGQQIVIAGYSQGAWAVHSAISYLGGDSPLLAHVSGVALLADPMRSPNGLTNEGSANAGSGIATEVLGQMFLRYYDFISSVIHLGFPDSPDPKTHEASYPESMYSVTLGYCDAADTVCDTSSYDLSPMKVVGSVRAMGGAGVAVHGGYASRGELGSYGGSVASVVENQS